MSARHSTVSPSLVYHTSNFCILFVFILSQVQQLTPTINACLSAPPIPYHVHSLAFSRKSSREGNDWLLIVMDEFLITFALMLQLHPPITLVLPLHLLLLFTCSFVSPCGLFVFYCLMSVAPFTTDFVLLLLISLFFLWSISETAVSVHPPFSKIWGRDMW